ncbi:hypothetical protein R1sor_012354 [Riccia sorocarpa]|uniref:Leucine-rich repeat-containing N-terminal plant-type domain-containing protein n=1 Tax=Riccia sorocarpa TaxID=122646 RepID=A0ABD3I3I7_9MARC
MWRRQSTDSVVFTRGEDAGRDSEALIVPFLFLRSHWTSYRRQYQTVIRWAEPGGVPTPGGVAAEETEPYHIPYPGLVSDGESLLKFKATVVNVDGSNLDLLSSWGPSGKDPCNGNVSDDTAFGTRMESSWQGLYCFNSSRAGWEVSELQLSLSIPPLVSSDVSALSELTKLQNLYLTNMMLSGALPDVGKMETLTNLDLSGNRFNGSLPQRFPSSLLQIKLSNNSLSGDVHDTNLFTLQSLVTLNLSENNLTGTFPDMSGLQRLTEFDISQNGFEGLLPSGITNLSLVYCNMSVNRFSGSVRLPGAWSDYAVTLDLSRNRLDALLSIRSGVSRLDLSSNHLTYEVLGDICTSNFTSLRELHLGDNNLQGDASILSALNYSCPNLEVLDLRNSGLSGSIDIFANQTMSFLKTLDLSGNSLRGSLSLARMFAGKPYLQELWLQNNFLTGEQQGGSVDIWTFDSRSDAIITSESLSSYANITSLDLSSNQLTIETSWIEQILKISALRYLDLSSGNQVIPGVLPNLTSLKFTASPTSLEFLGLRSLQLTGSIPPLFIIRDFFPSLKTLDLSNNSLQGSLPNWFWYVQGVEVNISGNRFSGKLPSIPSVLLNTQPFLGNDKLCLSGPLGKAREF